MKQEHPFHEEIGVGTFRLDSDEEDHEKNVLHRYCRAVEEYRDLGFPDDQAMLYASWSFNFHNCKVLGR